MLTDVGILVQIPVPRRYHRALFGEKAIFLRDIENKTNCKITFPGDGLGAYSHGDSRVDPQC